MATNLEELVVKLNADAELLHREMKRAERRVDGSVRNMNRSLKRADKQWKKFGAAIKGAMAIAVAEMGRRSLGVLIQISDQYTELTSRVKQITRETGGYQRVLESVYATAGRTGTAIGDNLALVQRLSPAAKEMGRTVEDVLKLNRAVQQLSVIGGTSQTAIAAGTLQLAQGLSAGVFRAEEFNSVLENTPEVAIAIADGLNMSVGELRNMVLQGKVTSEMVFGAILGQTEKIAERMREVETTIGRAWASLTQNMSRAATSGGGVDFFADVIESLNALMFDEGLSDDALLSKRDAVQELMNTLLDRGWDRDSAGIRARIDEIKRLNELIEARGIGGGLVGPMPASTTAATQDTSSLGFRVSPITKPDIDGIEKAKAALRDLEVAHLQSNDKMAEAARILADERIKHFERMKEAGIISEEELAQAVILINETTENTLKKLQDSTLKDIKEAIESFSREAAQDLTNLALSGELSAKRIGEAFARLALNKLFNIFLTKPLEGMFNNILSPAGGLAGGGTIQANVPTLVGERGPELYVPNASGKILNNHNTKSALGGSSPVINQTINMHPALQNTVRAEARMAVEMALPQAIEALNMQLAGVRA